MAVTPTRVRTAVYLAVGAVLTAAVVVGGILAARLAEAAARAQGNAQAYQARLAWVCVVVAALAAVVLVWLAVRFFAFRLTAEERAAPTEHVDAWKLSGQRFQMTKEDEEELERTWGEDEPEK